MMPPRTGRDREQIVTLLFLNVLFGVANLCFGSTLLGYINIALAAVFVEMLGRFFEYRFPFQRPDQ